MACPAKRKGRGECGWQAGYYGGRGRECGLGQIQKPSVVTGVSYVSHEQHWGKLKVTFVFWKKPAAGVLSLETRTKLETSSLVSETQG
jgi:hypothetical protein